MGTVVSQQPASRDKGRWSRQWQPLEPPSLVQAWVLEPRRPPWQAAQTPSQALPPERRRRSRLRLLPDRQLPCNQPRPPPPAYATVVLKEKEVEQVDEREEGKEKEEAEK